MNYGRHDYTVMYLQLKIYCWGVFPGWLFLWHYKLTQACVVMMTCQIILQNVRARGLIHLILHLTNNNQCWMIVENIFRKSRSTRYFTVDHGYFSNVLSVHLYLRMPFSFSLFLSRFFLRVNLMFCFFFEWEIKTPYL